jgi:hypothetical protein
MLLLTCACSVFVGECAGLLTAVMRWNMVGVLVLFVNTVRVGRIVCLFADYA